jgi:hypothetical protein
MYIYFEKLINTYKTWFIPDQIEAFLPALLAIASAMYHSGNKPFPKNQPPLGENKNRQKCGAR